MVEILYLSEKGRIPPYMLDLLFSSLNKQDTVLEVEALNLSILQEMKNVPRDIVPDKPDRIIAATALHLGMPLISRDMKIQLSGVKTIW